MLENYPVKEIEEFRALMVQPFDLMDSIRGGMNGYNYTLFDIAKKAISNNPNVSDEGVTSLDEKAEKLASLFLEKKLHDAFYIDPTGMLPPEAPENHYIHSECTFDSETLLYIMETLYCKPYIFENQNEETKEFYEKVKELIKEESELPIEAGIYVSRLKNILSPVRLDCLTFETKPSFKSYVEEMAALFNEVISLSEKVYADMDYGYISLMNIEGFLYMMYLELTDRIEN